MLRSLTKTFMKAVLGLSLLVGTAASVDAAPPWRAPRMFDGEWQRFEKVYAGDNALRPSYSQYNLSRHYDEFAHYAEEVPGSMLPIREATEFLKNGVPEGIELAQSQKIHLKLLKHIWDKSETGRHMIEELAKKDVLLAMEVSDRARGLFYYNQDVISLILQNKKRARNWSKTVTHNRGHFEAMVFVLAEELAHAYQDTVWGTLMLENSGEYKLSHFRMWEYGVEAQAKTIAAMVALECGWTGHGYTHTVFALDNIGDIGTMIRSLRHDLRYGPEKLREDAELALPAFVSFFINEDPLNVYWSHGADASCSDFYGQAEIPAAQFKEAFGRLPLCKGNFLEEARWDSLDHLIEFLPESEAKSGFVAIQQKEEQIRNTQQQSFVDIDSFFFAP